MSARRAAPGPLPAYVLHSWDWSESSLIVELFTRERGRITVVAKGAKRPHSNLRAVLLPLQRINVQLGRSEEGAEVHPLRGAEWAGGPGMPAGAALFAGFHLNELLLRLVARQDAHPALFDAYGEAVQALQGDESAVQLALRAFELTLLRETGVLPELDHETLTQLPLRPDARYRLDAEAGVLGAGAADDGVLTGEALLCLEAALARRDTPALWLAARPVNAPLRAALRQLLHYHLGSPALRTRRVMIELQQLIDREATRR